MLEFEDALNVTTRQSSEQDIGFSVLFIGEIISSHSNQRARFGRDGFLSGLSIPVRVRASSEPGLFYPLCISHASWKSSVPQPYSTTGKNFSRFPKNKLFIKDLWVQEKSCFFTSFSLGLATGLNQVKVKERKGDCLRDALWIQFFTAAQLGLGRGQLHLQCSGWVSKLPKLHRYFEGVDQRHSDLFTRLNLTAFWEELSSLNSLN